MKKTHVIANNRDLKIKKILFVLNNYLKLNNDKKILSVGVGSGLMEEFLQKNGFNVIGVDVVDSRITKSFPFKLIDDEKLPFKKNSFDIIISNHVIEHVLNQNKHLSEMKRILKHGGFVYLATPNKYSFIEPHYKIPFLSWFKQENADTIVKFFRKNDCFDILPLTRKMIIDEAKKAGFQKIDEITDELLYFYLKNEKQFNISKKKSKKIYQIIKPVVPTIGYLLK